MPILKRIIPFAIVVTALCGLVCVAVQQNIRLGANDPQIQISEDLANSLGSGQDPASLSSSEPADISKSLAPYAIIFNEKGEVIVSTARLNGNTPKVPKGVLDYANAHGQNRITWQPAVGVRSAIVVTPYKGSKSGFVLVGRSLREVEKRESLLNVQVGSVWVFTMVLLLIYFVIFERQTKKKK